MMIDKIRDILKQREIENLYHFTRIENIHSILKRGLIPREKLDTENIDALTNDEYRCDNCAEANCLSVEFPNYKMFYKLWKNSGKCNWCVLELDVNILSRYRCVFCRTNAASAEMSELSIGERMGPDAFERIFEDYEGYPKRAETKIPSYYPINPQAEVLVFGTIRPCYIKRIILGEYRTYKIIEKQFGDLIPVECDSSYFSYRSDWEYWQS